MNGNPTPTALPSRSPAEAVAALCSRVRGVETEAIRRVESLGRVLAESIRADRPSPAADVSAMDGYVVRLADLKSGGIRVVGEARIGREPASMPVGGALRIVTGAPVPPGGEAVVKREDVGERGDSIVVSPDTARALKAGANIRRRGENLRAGDEAVAAGWVVSAPVSAAMASFGVATPRVFRRVRVGIVSTGDEVLPPEETPTPWQLRDGNTSALTGLLAGRAWIDTMPTRRAPDDPVAIRSAAAELLKSADALVLTGGVSMGDRDFVPRVVRELGAEVLFHRVPQRPGGPLLGAVMPDGRPVLGLPGNPLSVLVTARRLLIPVLERMGGVHPTTHQPAATLAQPDERRLDLWWFRLVRLVAPGAVELVATASSGDVAAAARSHGFIEIPPGQGGIGPWPFFGWSI